MSAKDPSSSSRTTLRVSVSSTSVGKNTTARSRPSREREEPLRTHSPRISTEASTRTDRTSRPDPRKARGPRDERPPRQNQRTLDDDRVPRREDRFDRTERTPLREKREWQDAQRAPRQTRDAQQRRFDHRRDGPPRNNTESTSANRPAHDGEQPGYGGIRTYRAPADLKGKAAPIKVIRPQETDTSPPASAPHKKPRPV